MADKDIFKLLMQYKYVQTSGFKNPVLFKRLGLSLYDYKHLYFFLVCDLSYLILRMYILIRKRVNRAITPYFLRLNHVYNKIKDKKDK